VGRQRRLLHVAVHVAVHVSVHVAVHMAVPGCACGCACVCACGCAFPARHCGPLVAPAAVEKYTESGTAELAICVVWSAAAIPLLQHLRSSVQHCQILVNSFPTDAAAAAVHCAPFLSGRG
jgi:hypothetical protein